MERKNSEALSFERIPPEKQKPVTLCSRVYPLRYHIKLEIQ